MHSNMQSRHEMRPICSWAYIVSTGLISVRNICKRECKLTQRAVYLEHTVAPKCVYVLACVCVIYRHFVDYRFVDLRFVYKLNTKTSYSWLTKPKTPKLNAKTGGLCPPEPP